jgi:cyclopropane fatty-acyl-phospholipid synthase-like methyltransferase
MMSTSKQRDLASRKYWSAVWQQPGRAAFQPIGSRGRDAREMDRFFRAQLRNEPPRPSLIEIGCGNSSWLPYFALELGCSVSGIDYSDDGCQAARQVLSDAGVEGTIHCADVFDPPADLLARHDVVVSLGLVEHFTDCAGVLAAVARFAKPGGLILTTLPTLAGWVGSAQRWLDRRIYDLHVPLSREHVREAHQRAGLRVESCEYSLPLDFHVCQAAPGRQLPHRLLMKLSALIGASESAGLRLPLGRRTATLVVCAATVPN